MLAVWWAGLGVAGMGDIPASPPGAGGVGYIAL
eukprot:COSAG05_NODE_2538_length_2931_cov_3.885593_1_plen_33_part_00